MRVSVAAVGCTVATEFGLPDSQLILGARRVCRSGEATHDPLPASAGPHRAEQ